MAGQESIIPGKSNQGNHEKHERHEKETPVDVLFRVFRAFRGGSPDQCRNRNSFELMSAHWMSSHALRLSAFLARCSKAAFTSPCVGTRDSVARYRSLRMSVSGAFLVMRVPMRLAGLRSFSLIVGPL